MIRVTKKHNPIIYPYKLHNIELKATENAKYLGVMINKEFSWKPHTENMTSKAFNTLKFIKRNVQTKKSKNKGNSIQHLCQLEYCTPWQEKLTYKIDRVQRAAARYCLNDYNFTSSVTEMLKVLNWQTLENRRIQNSLILLYKIKHNLVAVDHHHLTETKNLNFFIPYSRTRYHMNSY